VQERPIPPPGGRNIKVLNLRKNNRKRGKPSLSEVESSTIGDIVAVSEIFQGLGFRV
jgi:hypothetical protein